MILSALRSFFSAFPFLIGILPSTILIFLCFVLIGIILGLILAIIKFKKNKVINFIITIFVSFERGTPLLTQLFLVYFGFPAILQLIGLNAWTWNPVIFVIIAYGLNMGAFLSETFRGAYLSIEKGQIEAAESIGMNQAKILTRVILPQGFSVALPNMANLIIDGLKASSLAFSIGVVDIMGKGTQIASTNYGVGQLGTFICVATIYWIICFILEKIFYFAEKQFCKNVKILGNSAI